MFYLLSTSKHLVCTFKSLLFQLADLKLSFYMNLNIDIRREALMISDSGNAIKH